MPRAILIVAALVLLLMAFLHALVVHLAVRAAVARRLILGKHPRLVPIEGQDAVFVGILGAVYGCLMIGLCIAAAVRVIYDFFVL